MSLSVLIALTIILSLANTILLTFLFLRKNNLISNELKNSLEGINKNQERSERMVLEEIARNRQELQNSLNGFNQSVTNDLLKLTQMNSQKLENVRETVEERLKALQEENSQRLEKMRETVDEKLHSTLEKRLGESFKMVSDRLEKVHQGLGEMQTLAAGVGDLKKVLTNVKTRGIWGEVQLGNLLEQILTPEQYDRNVVTKKGSKDPVEFAIRLPGQDNHIVYLPIDAKFPTEDYERLQLAQDAANSLLVEEATKALEGRIKLEAKNIRDKYLDPPFTTDFAILFLPTESLYAEVLRRPGLGDQLRQDFRVIVTGPTTIAALLNSLQMGFRTLSVERRASEVWTLLGVVKTEFGKFGDLLQKTHDKLKQATETIEDATRKTRTIERRLKEVQELPSQSQSAELLEEKHINAIAE